MSGTKNRACVSDHFPRHPMESTIVNVEYLLDFVQNMDELMLRVMMTVAEALPSTENAMARHLYEWNSIKRDMNAEYESNCEGRL